MPHRGRNTHRNTSGRTPTHSLWSKPSQLVTTDHRNVPLHRVFRHSPFACSIRLRPPRHTHALCHCARCVSAGQARRPRASVLISRLAFLSIAVFAVAIHGGTALPAISFGHASTVPSFSHVAKWAGVATLAPVRADPHGANRHTIAIASVMDCNGTHLRCRVARRRRVGWRRCGQWRRRSALGQLVHQVQFTHLQRMLNVQRTPDGCVPPDHHGRRATGCVAHVVRGVDTHTFRRLRW
eukprot:TRINITY_DN4054_c0_g1_i1.p1 TRINITY_DN4054_c0_g1~~TRINITY_DN4054_c0_g1_i1.p1  ORF type:complete len:251 (+),score=-46.25 TRINITY_DN4054_c0_g1_i1:38-754(+)